MRKHHKTGLLLVCLLLLPLQSHSNEPFNHDTKANQTVSAQQNTAGPELMTILGIGLLGLLSFRNRFSRRK